MFIQSRESGSDKPSDGRLLDILDSLRVDETEEVSDHHEQPTSSVVSLVHSEESPSCDYHMKLTEEESQLSDIDKLWQEREGAAQQGSKNTKKVELSSYFSPDENMRKPLLDDEHL